MQDKTSEDRTETQLGQMVYRAFEIREVAYQRLVLVRDAVDAIVGPTNEKSQVDSAEDLPAAPSGLVGKLDDELDGIQSALVAIGNELNRL